MTPTTDRGAALADLVTVRRIEEARERIASRIHRTPVTGSTHLSERAGVRCALKLELFQKTGSFKVRGVLNRLDRFSPEERARGAITLSAGNHAQALAWGASASGIGSTVVMPATAVRSKVEATRGYGGEVVLTEGDLLATCLDLQAERGAVLVHPFDDPDVIAGAGTVGLEIVEDVPDVDVVICGVGGGGLLAGLAAAVRGLRPEARVVGVEPEGADAMSRSVAAGEPVKLERVSTIADGLAAPFAGARNLAHAQALVDRVIRVTDTEILAAMTLLMERCKLFPEPAAAAALAGLLSGRAGVREGERVVCVVSGGNIDLERLKTYV